MKFLLISSKSFDQRKRVVNSHLIMQSRMFEVPFNKVKASQVKSSFVIHNKCSILKSNPWRVTDKQGYHSKTEM